MTFSEEEIKEIEGTAAIVPAIGKLWEEYKKYQEDAGAKFYKSLHNCTEALTKELDAVHSGKWSKLRLLESNSNVWKRITGLLMNGKKIMVNINSVRDMVGGEENKMGIVKNIEEENISITDKMANDKK